jgi:hypothetical protein
VQTPKVCAGWSAAYGCVLAGVVKLYGVAASAVVLWIGGWFMDHPVAGLQGLGIRVDVQWL